MAVREEQLEKYGCKRVAKLPKGARRLVKTSYQRYSKQWSRLVAYEKSLIAQSAIHRLGETAQSGDDKPESDAEFSRAGSPSSDDDRDGASGSASGGAVGGASGDAVGGASGDADRDGEADEQPEAGEAGSLDAFPSGEAAEYDAAAALEVCASIHLAHAADDLVYARQSLPRSQQCNANRLGVWLCG